MLFGEKIIYYRKKAGLSQEALAEKLGVSRQAVSKWETGESQPELGNLTVLAKTLGVSVDQLLNEEVPVEDIPVPSQSTQERKYPDWLDHLPGFLKNMIYRYGWLMGVYYAVAGALVIGLGVLGNFITGKMISGFRDTTESFMNVFGSMDPYFGTGADPFSQMTDLMGNATENMLSFNPVSIICNVMIVIGVVLVIGGAILALALKTYGEKKK